MHKITLHATFVVTLLSACAASVPTPPADRTAIEVRSLIENRSLQLCETEENKRNCKAKSNGLTSRGLGGVFLPLVANLKAMNISGEKTRIDLDVNNIPASCTNGTVTYKNNQNNAVVGGIYCNWVGIGNVLTSAQLNTDWSEPDGSFGGRYAIQFYGTGNGGGSGFFRASPAKK
ncbi:MAG: hypothetical protein AAGF53_15505 [Pseudomonadota bacterium]